jgi:hypothetical protein
MGVTSAISFIERMALARVHKAQRNANAPENHGDKAPLAARFSPDAADAANWQRLASERGFRLPSHATPCTVGKMRRWLRRLGWTPERFTAWSGYKQLADWSAANPTWGLWSFVGLLLEEWVHSPTQCSPSSQR